MISWQKSKVPPAALPNREAQLIGKQLPGVMKQKSGRLPAAAMSFDAKIAERIIP